MIVLYKTEIPFTLLLLPFLAGLGLDIVFPCNVYLNFFRLAFCVIFFLFIGLNFGYQRLRIYKARWIGGVLVSVLLLLAGYISFEGNRQINSTTHFSKATSAYLIGTIDNEPKLNNNILRFTVNIKQGGNTHTIKPLSGNLLVAMKIDSTQKPDLFYGDEMILPGKFNPVEAPLNPAEFNYKAYLAHQNIYNQTFLVRNQVVVLNHDQGNSIIAKALKLRLYLVNKLKTTMRDTDAIAVASTIILGYRAELCPEVREAYAKTGTMHLLSVAGMHIGLVYLMITFLLNFLPNSKHRKLVRSIISIVLIWCYALITGFSPAVSRAALMLTIVIIGLSYNRHINKLNVLAVSAFILLLYNPFLITDAGFQLSYLAVFGIITIQPYIYKWFTVKHWFTRELWLVGSVSISAQIILFPIGALYFHDFPVYFLISNIFIIIPSAIVMYAGISYLALPHIPGVSAGLGWILEKTVVFMTKTLTLFEHAPGGNINKIWLTPLEFVAAYGLIAAIFCLFTRWDKKWIQLSLILGLTLSVSYGFKTYRASTTNSLTFFSLRKNSGILFKKGDQGILLTDLKPADKAYQYSIQPYLDSCLINQLSTLNTDTLLNFIRKSGNLIQFRDQKILIMNPAIAGKKFSDKLTIDYIYISNNPDINLQYLKENYNFKTLIADGSNSTRRINKLEQEAVLAKVDFKNLKRNKSFILESNN